MRALQIGFSVVTLAVLALQLDWGQLGTVVAAASPVWLLAALAAALVDRAWMIGKWLPLLRVHVPEIGVMQAARAYLAAGFTNYLLPSTVGSDALRAAALGRPRGQAVEVGASIAAERLLGMLANGVLVGLAVGVTVHAAVEVEWPSGIVAGVLALTFLAAVLPFVPRVRRVVRDAWHPTRLQAVRVLIQRFVRAYVVYSQTPGLLAVVALLTQVEVFFPLGIHWLLAQALGLEVPLPALLAAVAVSGLLAKVPLSVAGLGVQELTLATILASFGTPGEAGAALALGYRAIDIIIALPGAFLLRDLYAGLRRPEVARSEAL